MTLDEVLDEFNAGKTSIRCSRVRELLEALGFEVRDGKQGGHKIFVHDQLPDFYSGSYNCGHGKNPEVKPAYIKKIIQVLKQHSSTLEELNGRTQ